MNRFLLAVSLACFACLFGSYTLMPSAAAAEDTKSTRVLRHVVLFQFKSTSTPEDVKKIVAAFKQLPSQISQIKSFECGTNNSPENLNEGLTHCFLVTFGSEEDRSAYLTHPAHVKFVELLKPHLERPVVVDYWTE